MRRAIPLFLVALLLSLSALGNDTYLGTITGSASTTNLTTATPFRLGAGWKISVQCDADTYLAEGTAAAPPTVTANNGLKVTAGSLFDIDLTDDSNASATNFALGLFPVSGTSNCKVFLSSHG